MTLTKERKIYLALLGIGLAALVLDRLIGGPQNAQAREDSAAFVVERPNGAAPAAAPSAATGQLTLTGPDLSVRLRTLGEQVRPGSQSRDLFRAPATWGPRITHAPAPAQVTDLTGPAVEFERSHRLTAVLLSGRERHAVVDGKMVKPGQAIDGFTLISVSHDTAIFRSGAATAVLRTEIKVQ